MPIPRGPRGSFHGLTPAQQAWVSGMMWQGPEQPATSQYYHPDISKIAPNWPKIINPEDPFFQTVPQEELDKVVKALPTLPKIPTIDQRALGPGDIAAARGPQQAAATAPPVSPLGNIFGPSSPLMTGTDRHPGKVKDEGGSRFDQLSQRDQRDLALTIAGEVDPSRSPYGAPKTTQEIANIVETITTRAANEGKSISQVVHERKQYSTWNDEKGRRIAAQNLKAFGPDITNAIQGAINGTILPTNEGLTHYHSVDVHPGWMNNQPTAKVGPHIFYNNVNPPQISQLPPAPVGPVTSANLPNPPPLPGPPTVGGANAVASVFNAPGALGPPPSTRANPVPQSNPSMLAGPVGNMDGAREMQTQRARRDIYPKNFNVTATAESQAVKKAQAGELATRMIAQHPEDTAQIAKRMADAGLNIDGTDLTPAAPVQRPANPLQPPMQMGVNSVGPTGFVEAGVPTMSQAQYDAAMRGAAPSQMTGTDYQMGKVKDDRGVTGPLPTQLTSMIAARPEGAPTGFPAAPSPDQRIAGAFDAAGAASAPSPALLAAANQQITPQARIDGAFASADQAPQPPADAMQQLAMRLNPQVTATAGTPPPSPTASGQMPTPMDRINGAFGAAGAPSPIPGAIANASQSLGERLRMEGGTATSLPAPATQTAVASPQIRQPMDLTGTGGLAPPMPTVASGAIPDMIQGPFSVDASMPASPGDRITAALGPQQPLAAPPTPLGPVNAESLGAPPGATAAAGGLPVGLGPLVGSAEAGPLPPGGIAAAGPIGPMGPPSMVRPEGPLGSFPGAPPSPLASPAPIGPLASTEALRGPFDPNAVPGIGSDIGATQQPAPPIQIASLGPVGLGPMGPMGTAPKGFPMPGPMPGIDFSQVAAPKPTPVPTAAVHAISPLTPPPLAVKPIAPPAPPSIAPPAPIPSILPPLPGTVPNPALTQVPPPARINLAGAPQKKSRVSEVLHTIAHPISAVTGIPTPAEVARAALQARILGGIFGPNTGPGMNVWQGGGGYGQSWGGGWGGIFGNGTGMGGSEIGLGVGGGYNPNK